jgi:hypothetical protein
MAFDLTTLLGSNLGQMFKDVVGQFHESAEDKAKFQSLIDANAAAIAAKQIELQEKAEDSYQVELNTASANIRAEMLTGDKFTVRARPSYIYVVEVILLGNFIVFPLLGKEPIKFPTDLYYLFGVCITGYIGARSWDKRTATTNGLGKSAPR